LLADSIDGTAYTWNTSSFPDGLYRLKLVVSDSTSNPPGAGRSAERTSALFRVDHTAPEITRLEFRPDGNGLLLDTAGRDGGGIARAGSAVEGKDGSARAPEEGIFEGNEESFHRHIDRNPSGEHVVVVRMLDETGNESVRRATLKR